METLVAEKQVGQQMEQQVKDILISRQYLYRLFFLLTSQEPTEQILDAVFSEATFLTLGLLEANGSKQVHRLIQEMREQAAAYSDNRDRYLDDAESAYTRLFIGPMGIKAPPWECVYLSGNRLLLQESTLAVRDAYRQAGFLPLLYPRVSDDHIAIELDFSEKLIRKGLDAIQAGNVGEGSAVLEVQVDFLHNHLLQWVPNYSKDLSREAGITSLYGVIAQLLNVFIIWDDELAYQSAEQHDGDA